MCSSNCLSKQYALSRLFAKQYALSLLFAKLYDFFFGSARVVVDCAKTGTDQQLGEDARKRVHAPSSRFLEDVPPNMGSIKSECLDSTE